MHLFTLVEIAERRHRRARPQSPIDAAGIGSGKADTAQVWPLERQSIPLKPRRLKVAANSAADPRHQGISHPRGTNL